MSIILKELGIVWIIDYILCIAVEKRSFNFFIYCTHEEVCRMVCQKHGDNDQSNTEFNNLNRS